MNIFYNCFIAPKSYYHLSNSDKYICNVEEDNLKQQLFQNKTIFVNLKWEFTSEKQSNLSNNIFEIFSNFLFGIKFNLRV